MIIGRAGTGKTTLVNHLVGSLNPQQIKVANISASKSNPGNLLHQISQGFCLDSSGLTKVALLNNLNKTLRQYSRTNTHALLVIDDAHNLAYGALQDIRRLTSMQANQQPLLHVFLFGPESLGNRVIAMGMEQANKRSLITLSLEPLSASDTRQYILHRLSKAGWESDPCIDLDAFSLIYAVSRGIPRLINRVCNRLLEYGANEKTHELRKHDIQSVINILRQEHLAARNPKPVDKSQQQKVDNSINTEYSVANKNIPHVPPYSTLSTT